MLARPDWGIGCRSLYSGTRALRLLRGVAGLTGLICALAVAGCSLELPLFAKDESDGDRTGSITRPVDQVAAVADAAGASEDDLAYARAAAAEVLAHGGNDTSLPWQNPQTGASGNITPLAASYTEGGQPCRDFLASYVHGESHDWLQGAACRTSAGKWHVTRLKPLSRS